MKSLTNILFVIASLVFAFASPACADSKTSIEDLLDSLDNAINQREAVMAKKQTVLNDLKRSLGERLTPDQQAAKYQQLYQEYVHINGDSAIFYAQKAVDAAELTKNQQTILYSRFCLLRAYTRQGAMGKAYEIISQIGDIDNIAPSYRGRYADLLLDFSTRVNGKLYAGNGVSMDADEAWKRYAKYLNKNTVEYDYHEALITGKCNVSKMERDLKSLPYPSFTRASLYYALAFEYKRRGDTDKFYSFLIMSATNDVLLGNTEAASLLELLQTPLLKNDLKRSYAYVQVCADNVKQYNDMLRALTVVDVQGRINKQFNDVRARQMTLITIIAVLFFLALVFSIVETRLAVARGKKVKQSLDALKVMHTKQQELMENQRQLSEELKEANARLGDRLAAYRNDFVNVYQLVSTYISYEKGLIKNLLNQLKTNNVRKAISILNSGADIDNQLKDFYQHFDHAFLAMYPDFIHRMNTLLKPDCQLDESQEGLTTSLRIYALLVLGVTDGAGISDFLHISSQTIYNYRLRMRRNAINGDKRFDEDVAALY